MRFSCLFALFGLAVGSPTFAWADPDPASATGPAAYDSQASGHKSVDPTSGYVPPRHVPYQGGDIPSGAHIETRPDIAYIATGASIFGSAYVTSLVYGLSTCGAQSACRPGSGWLYLPLVGPFVTSAQAPTTGGQALAAFDGGVQVLGVALAIVGFVVPRKFVMWQSKTATLSFSPTLGSLGGPAPLTGDAKPAMRNGVSITLSSF